MKKLFAVSMLMLSSMTFAAEMKLNNFNWTLTDISSKGLKSETLYKNIERKLINFKSSICSNRALMWNYELEGKYNIDTAKIFLFYTKSSGINEQSLRGWWYHVAPVVNEKGVATVIDGGFPSFIPGPMTTEAWMQKFSKVDKCKEIQPHETELIEKMFNGSLYDEVTPYGYNRCYYMITPSPFWTPMTIATEILGRDENGRAPRISRDRINQGELEYACIEATTNRVGRFLGGAGAKEKCEEFMSRY